jgi:hypothetical protein
MVVRRRYRSVGHGLGTERRRAESQTNPALLWSLKQQVPDQKDCCRPISADKPRLFSSADDGGRILVPVGVVDPAAFLVYASGRTATRPNLCHCVPRRNNLGGWSLNRFERERSRHAAELRKAWADQSLEPPVAPEPEPRPLSTHEPESKLPPVQTAPRPRGWWECKFCGRGFHGYGSYLNHRCHSDITWRSPLRRRGGAG